MRCPLFPRLRGLLRIPLGLLVVVRDPLPNCDLHPSFFFCSAEFVGCLRVVVAAPVVLVVVDVVVDHGVGEVVVHVVDGLPGLVDEVEVGFRLLLAGSSSFGLQLWFLFSCLPELVRLLRTTAVDLHSELQQDRTSVWV